MICTKCGNEIAEGASFCSNCGTRAVQPQPVTDTAEEVKEAPAAQNVEKVIEEAAPKTESEALRAENSAPATAHTPAPATAPTPAPAAASAPTAAPTPAPVQTKGYNGFSQPVPPPPPIPFADNRKPVKPPKAEKPKTFFGKGALALCLVIIGILSCSTTVFATLFFTLLGRM